jgi:demethylmenaquinone methyltransferase / 2-methoxy-6-polyprenyl-1,4-benzoquinol methylase
VVTGLDLALELLDRSLRGLQSPRERRRPAGVEFSLEAACRGADLVQAGGSGELWRVAHYVPQRDRRRLGVLDSLRRLPRTKVGESSDEPLEVAASRTVGRHLAQRSDRDRGADLRPARHGRAVLANAQPAAHRVGVVDGAKVDAPSRRGLSREDPRHGGPGAEPCSHETGDALEILPQPHVAHNRRVAMDARELFAPIGPSYDRVGALLSFGQDPRWRRFLVSRLPGDGGRVLDVATGTGLVAAELVRRGFRVTGVDQSTEMLAGARRRFQGRVELVEASAESLPFADGAFDHLTVTYLLRYVEDPGATLAELARVVRPGGVIASLEFGVPSGIARPAWELYVRAGLPLAGRLLRNGWREVGDFLGGSIRSFWEVYPQERQRALWGTTGIEDVGVRRLSLGGGVVMWGRRT